VSPVANDPDELLEQALEDERAAAIEKLREREDPDFTVRSAVSRARGRYSSSWSY
jgi:hypothetical protein